MTTINGAPEQDARAAEITAFPFVSVTTQSSGIHPSTSRMVSIDALTFNEDGDIGEEFHAVLNPGTDPGPHHCHGLSHEEVAAGKPFSQILRTLDRFIDGRVLILHNAPRTWGFIVSESRRAMNAAARANRSRGRGRGRGRRRQRVGHVPAPAGIVDTLATARRRLLPLDDARLGTLAVALGMPADEVSPLATVERARLPEHETTRQQTDLLIDVYLHLDDTGELATHTPEQLRADRFGLQRSRIRVDATEAPRPHPNPGTHLPGRNLVRGMEVVVTPEVQVDPDELIAACMRAELVYSEKLTRTTSLVVCNIDPATTAPDQLRGKAMHAVRKGIPLLSDTAFLDATSRVRSRARRQPPSAPGTTVGA